MKKLDFVKVWVHPRDQKEAQSEFDELLKKQSIKFASYFWIESIKSIFELRGLAGNPGEHPSNDKLYNEFLKQK